MVFLCNDAAMYCDEARADTKKHSIFSEKRQRILTTRQQDLVLDRAHAMYLHHTQ